MFKQTKPKNAFLQKRSQEKAKAAEHQKTKLATVTLQKNIKAYLQRQRLLQQAIFQKNIKLNLIMKHQLHHFSKEDIWQFLEKMKEEPQRTQLYFYSEFVIQNIREQKYQELAVKILNQQSHQYLRSIIIARPEFLSILEDLFLKKKVQSFLNSTVEQVRSSGILSKVDGEIILSSLLHHFRSQKMEIQNNDEFTPSSLLLLIETLFLSKYSIATHQITHLCNLILFFIKTISGQNHDEILCYLLEQVLSSGLKVHEEITLQLMETHKQIIVLIEDEEMMEEVEEKMRREELMEDFTNDYLASVRKIMTHPEVIKMFYSGQHQILNQILLKIINELTVIFQSHKLIFIRQIISSDSVLNSLAHSKDPMFRQGLKMRLLAMDDPEFKSLNIFTQKQWHNIIKSCNEVADIKIQKLVQKSMMQPQLIPFKKRNKDQLQLKTVVDLLSNLHKKVLRTGKLDPQVFVDYGLSAQLKYFLFGKGALKIQSLLKQLPFMFSFESRMGKFKQFIKQDKKYHDRSLFLQEEVDEDLIIEVRRGHEFMDAFEACITRDLRKKYKIVFFNQQGLEEEGVDGGGIIKEFINRVLKSAFSQTYSLFMQTPLNQIIPNPYSNGTQQYEFVGKLIGKAVYQGINIQQKFAQPFLNLLIGRHNTFEDLQYIDPDIYRSLVSLKNTSDDISQFHQTFVIYDHLPNGHKKYIDLLCPSKPPTNNQVLVTNQNKMDFVLRYADFKCNKQIQEKTRYFRKGFLKVIKSEWLTMFSNEELNSIISGSNPDFNVEEMKDYTVYKDYHQKDQTIILFWQVLRQMNSEQKSLLLLYITSCSRPPTLGFGAMKPKICISRDEDASHLPTANTCMNVLRLPNYKNKALLKKKLMYAINAKAGFEFA